MRVGSKRYYTFAEITGSNWFAASWKLAYRKRQDELDAKRERVGRKLRDMWQEEEVRKASRTVKVLFMQSNWPLLWQHMTAIMLCNVVHTGMTTRTDEDSDHAYHQPQQADFSTRDLASEMSLSSCTRYCSPKVLIN